MTLGQTSQLIGTLALALYVASTLILYRTVSATPKDKSPAEPITGRKPAIWLIAIAAAFFHAIMLADTTFNSTGLNLDFLNALSVTAWVTVTITLLLNTGQPVINLGLILFPASAFILLLCLLFSIDTIAVEPEIRTHVLISIIAYSLLTIAAGQSVLVSLQDRRLHNHRPGGFLYALPPLKVMETVLFQLLVTSFLTLSLALISGFIWLDDLFEQHLVHKTTLSLFAWLLLAILLTGQICWGWRGQKAAKLTIGAFVCLLLGYFGSKFVLEVLLN